MAPRRSRRLKEQSSNKEISLPNQQSAISARSTSNKNKQKSTSGKNKSKGTSNKSRKRSVRRNAPCVTNLPEVIDIVDLTQITVPSRKRTVTSRNHRPPVINLDVTYSSESSDESDVDDVEEISVPQSNVFESSQQKLPKPQTKLRNGHCSVSDSDEDFVPDFCPREDKIQNQDSKDTLNESLAYDLDSVIDIYKVSYKDEREKAFEELEKELKKMSEKERKKRKRDSTPLLEDSLLNETPPTVDITDNGDTDDDDSLLLASLNHTPTVDLSLRSRKRGRSIVRTSKKTKAALASLQAFSKRLEEDMKNANESNDSFDDIIPVESSEISIRICWGNTYTRHILKEDEKFISLYQEFAEKHKVSVNEVVLSFNDKILTPDTRPLDISLSIGDIIDGAIITNSSKRENETGSMKNEEGLLSFKVQCSNRKEVHTVSINKYDKMSFLMEKYSNLRNIPLTKLRFKFDGESIESSDTPASLDLEGGECIDVYEL